MSGYPGAHLNPTMQPFKVAFPGEEGSLAHNATIRFFATSSNAEFQGVGGFADVMQAIKAGRALYGVLPIENSSSGSVPQVHDLMVEHEVLIGGEVGMRENYCICGKEGTQLAAIKRVLSHTNILDACSLFIDKKLTAGVEQVSVSATTEAARQVANCDAKAECSAAIATRESAKKFKLEILAPNIGNYTLNETRYVVVHARTGPVASMPAPFPRDAVSPVRKHSCIFALKDEPAALYKILSCWALRNINVLKMETRPFKGTKATAELPVHNLWDWLVFIDYAVPVGHTEEESKQLWNNLVEFTQWQRSLGIYPSQTSRAVRKEEQSWGDVADLLFKS